MEVVTEYADQRTELEEKIRSLEAEKAVLDEKAAAYEAEAGYDLPPNAVEGV